MKIHCFILKRDRTLKRKKVDSNRPYFEYNSGIYQILADCVNVSSSDGVIASHPELYYVEDLPQPINYEQPQTGESEAPPFLEAVLTVNAIEGLAGGPSQVMKMFKQALNKPLNLLLLVFVAIIAIAFIQGLFTF